MNNVVNYTEEETHELVQLYQAGESTAFLADKFSKSERSIIAKLVKQGVYKAKAVKASKPMLKAEIVARIAELLSTDEERVESLEKATGKALTLVLEALEACAHPAFVMHDIGSRGGADDSQPMHEDFDKRQQEIDDYRRMELSRFPKNSSWFQAYS